jgi:hypothetical protein
VTTKVDENAVDVALDTIGIDTDDDEAQLGETAIAKSIGIAPSSVNTAVDLDDEAERRCEEVDDARAENDLATKANAESIATNALPQERLGLCRIDAHRTRTWGKARRGDAIVSAAETNEMGTHSGAPFAGGRGPGKALEAKVS